MSSGARETLSVAWEVTPGVSPAPLVCQDVRFTQSTVGREVQLEESAEKGAGRISRGSIAIGIDVQGDVDGELSYGTYDKWFEAAFCGTWATNVLTTGNTIHTATVVRGFDDVAEWEVAKGCHVNTMSLSLASRSKATVSFGLMGMTGERVKTTDPRSTRTAVGDVPFMSSLSVGTVKVDTVELTGAACIESLDLNIDNTGKVTDCFVTGNKVTFLSQNITGSMVLAWNTKAADILEKRINRDTIEVEMGLTDSIGNAYTLNIPFAEVNGTLPSGGKDETLKATIEYQVVKGNITLTRAPFVGP